MQVCRIFIKSFLDFVDVLMRRIPRMKIDEKLHDVIFMLLCHNLQPRYNLKFHLLRTLCSHEHYMPINMPKMSKGRKCRNVGSFEPNTSANTKDKESVTNKNYDVLAFSRLQLPFQHGG